MPVEAMTKVVPVILAGGVGSRLWPISRTYFPKQFHALLGEHSFLQDTLMRAGKITQAAPLIVCNEEHRFLVAEQGAKSTLPTNASFLNPKDATAHRRLR
jgi:mannose-1-phosphate guanylyltransferase